MDFVGCGFVGRNRYAAAAEQLEMAGRSGQRHSPHSLSFVPRTTFCTAFVLDGNYYLPSGPEATRREQASVVSKHTKERQMTRRAGKYRYVANGVRRSYFLRLAFANGQEKTVPVSQAVYNRTRQGGTKKLMLTKGIFGLTVITGGLSGSPVAGAAADIRPGPHR